ncbi:restriction endonuclease subunit S [bacterium endosymbiont of Bathymodiolus sp. 5 South]|jgi:type I restriction enzyme S subunit|uniref:restriction endonuclease subunit S n=1 Tax=bacterium endosymbiont of Bathymodiolus sp. 5 South TaxID=1181670 RepID=UPI0010B92CE2|nr:restriction endonuclease subunit S [bacterium endosymbiont of Bathymodiolus sp. 5 South]SSC09334.1 Type I restriction-modification system, specificity subunit S [bacterium endosymbiont of Bathymodiolus sp. 5 South]VVH58994.1 Type I restriction-modification system, specificity subunit S (EC [uncultured Gammaproteobacteria bacterium]VVH62749.1 Type I restriction-modification system, specificity subunit S (EC [uncultured Gammaproteobacteria bacterium]VVM25633.1 Type I restriction-modification s
MKYGLSDKQLQEIKEILASYESVEKAVLFGSRAIDTYKEASDVDIAIKGEKADWSLAITIKEHLEEETYLPFFFDVVAYGSVESEELKQHIDGKGKVLFEREMSEWREVRLESVLEVKYGKDHKKLQDGLVPCYGTGGIMRYVNNELYDEESILIPRKGSLNNIYYLDEPFWTVDTLFWTKIDKDKVVTKFLFYQLTLIDFTILNVGSAVPSLTVPVLNEIDISLPPLPEQKAIAEVLSSLDDKIDLLHRQNKTLEQMAETLFRQWFVEEDGEDWGEGVLGDFFIVKTGKKNSNYGTDDGKYPFFTCSQKSILAPDYSFDGNAILLAGNGDFNIKRYSGKFEAYQRTYVLMPHEKKYFGFLYVLMKYFLNEITSGHQGSVINFITKGMIENFTVKLPKESQNTDQAFKELDEIFEKVDSNQKQIHTLQSLRDTLLPKLISGEVRIASNG